MLQRTKFSGENRTTWKRWCKTPDEGFFLLKEEPGVCSQGVISLLYFLVLL